MSKKYSELLKKLELTSKEKKALQKLQSCPSHKLSWPKGYESLMKPIGTAHAKLAISECLKEAKNLADSNPKDVACIHLQNTWFFSFNLFDAKQNCCYAYQMDMDLFLGAGKQPLHDSFNAFITTLFEITPDSFERRNRPAWNWMNIIIDFDV